MHGPNTSSTIATALKATTVKRRAGTSCSQSNVLAFNVDQRVEIGLGDQAVLIGREDGSVEAAQPDLLDVGQQNRPMSVSGTVRLKLKRNTGRETELGFRVGDGALEP